MAKGRARGVSAYFRWLWDLGYGTLVLIEKMPKINQEMRLF